MKGLISFSLFGDDPKYFTGLLKNIKLIKELYPTCDIVVYTTYSQEEIFQAIGAKEDLKIVSMEQTVGLSGMFWRFQALDIPNYDYYLFRDLDSQISHRETLMVGEWLTSNKNLHVMRDHPMHNAPVLGGMWGIRQDYKEAITRSLKENTAKGYYGEDQEFLWKNVYKSYRRDLLVHDRFFIREAKNVIRKHHQPDYSYVGEQFDELQRYSEEMRRMVEIWETSLSYRVRLRILSIIWKMLGR
jgi:hypothetical protein